MKTFKEKLKEWKGSLISVKDATKINKYARVYLRYLAKKGVVEKICNGWYWIPDKFNNIWEFLNIDKNFKLLFAQSATNIWNYGYITTNTISLVVESNGLKRALEAFGKKHNLNFLIKVDKKVKEKYRYFTEGGLSVEEMEDAITTCMQIHAYEHALAVIPVQYTKIDWNLLRKISYKKRISGTAIRIWSALSFSCQEMKKITQKEFHKRRRVNIKNKNIRESLEEAVEKVIENQFI